MVWLASTAGLAVSRFTVTIRPIPPALAVILLLGYSSITPVRCGRQPGMASIVSIQRLDASWCTSATHKPIPSLTTRSLKASREYFGLPAPHIYPPPTHRPHTPPLLTPTPT